MNEIQKMRVYRQLTQKQLSELSNVCLKTIRRLEHGKNARYVQRIKICNALGFSHQQVFKMDEDED